MLVLPMSSQDALGIEWNSWKAVTHWAPWKQRHRYFARPRTAKTIVKKNRTLWKIFLTEAPFSRALSVELKLMTLGFNFFADLVWVAGGQLPVAPSTAGHRLSAQLQETVGQHIMSGRIPPPHIPPKNPWWSVWDLFIFRAHVQVIHIGWKG